ncbi:MAG: hypothetical protein GC178_15995 [Flavobacteriales bacterium]|nr:hypothetical protein [Flavobacteriales bacterium]
MNVLFFISKLMVNAYLLASILNAVLTKRFLNYERLQNSIGIIFVLGNVLFSATILFTLFKTWYSGVANEEFVYEGISPGQALSRRGLLAVWWVIATALNAFRSLRTKRLTVFLTFLCFLPYFIEFFVVYTVSDVTLKTINRVYLVPLAEMFVAGPILYGSLVCWETGILFRKSKDR